MSAGVVIGILVGVLMLVAVAGFFAHRILRGESLEDAKQQYPPSSKGTTSGPDGDTQTQHTPTQSHFRALDAPSTKAAAAPETMLASTVGPVLGTCSSPSSQEPPRYTVESTVPGVVPPSATSPFHRKDAVQASRPSHSTFDAQSIEFHAAPGAYAESYTESYAGSMAGSMAESYAGSMAGSIAESYANSFSGTFNGHGVLDSFDASVDDFGRETVGTTVSEALERSSDHDEPSHWMDDMRGTNDSYAMLESGSFDRTSALSRFSTDSDLTGRPTQS
ncbi:hypothetical protein PsorP6_010988 [Peronosclerospora sorghi]|uniref:Uncharacterized protein n=1 Tax=Peronosclerospora sorghi TaxID=230839 RepID=A0ACC0VVZ0_9STRA|nr:hypothetical protein PsorP6_010988 [Peronosclerospora sorghi]